MNFNEAMRARHMNLGTFDMLKRELLARADELSRPGCKEAFGPEEVARFFRHWARTLDQAVGQIETDQGEIHVLMSLAATPMEGSKCN